MFIGNAVAESLSVLCTLPLQALGQGIVAAYKSQTGEEVNITINTGALIRERINKGEKFDLVITTRDVIEGWVTTGRLSKDGATGIGRIGYGLGIRKGYPKPDIGTVEAFKNALRGAQSIGGSEGSVALAFYERLVKDIGLADEVKPKTKVFPRGTFPKWIVNGEVDMVVSFMSEFIHLKETVDTAGPLPNELQSYVEFHAGVGAGEKAMTGRALKFLQFATGSSVDRIFQATGVDRLRH
jgi:molybdate transport system substrate-binding protein